MFPLNGGGSGPMGFGRPQPMGFGGQPQQNAAPQGAAPQQQSPTAQYLAMATQSLAKEGWTTAVQTAVESFFLMLQQLHQSASPNQAPPPDAEQMGFSSLPAMGAHSAPQPGGRY